ncbi:MAG: hypothetical protein WC099_02740 [Candidatus Paceibacterota bacterium]
MWEYIINLLIGLMSSLLGWFLKGVSYKKDKERESDKNRFIEIDKLIPSEYVYDLLDDISKERFVLKKLNQLKIYHEQKKDLPEMIFLNSKIEEKRQKFNEKVHEFMDFFLGRFFQLNEENQDISCLLPDQRNEKDKESVLMVTQARKKLIQLLRGIRNSYDSFKDTAKTKLML